MKTTNILLILLFSGSIIFAQSSEKEDEEPQYLFSNKDLHFSGFGGPTVGFTSINNQFATMNGGGGALLINQKFYFGGFGNNLSSNISRAFLQQSSSDTISYYDNKKLSFEYGGLWFGYIYDYKKVVHFGGSLKVGWGEVSYYDPYFDIDDADHIYKDNIFVFAPQAEVEVNLTHWFKINLGVGYRYVTGVDKIYDIEDKLIYQDSDFSSPFAQLTFAFGRFKN